ncbi:MAG: hypothetical protein ACYDH5_07165 [Acidimicrobiales bacterium]
MTNGNSFGKDAQYGKPSARYFGDLSSPVLPNPTCAPSQGNGNGHEPGNGNGHGNGTGGH